MTKESAAALAAEAAGADTPERKLAAIVTLEALQPGGILCHPETIMTIAERVDGGPLAAELDALAQSAGAPRRPE